MPPRIESPAIDLNTLKNPRDILRPRRGGYRRARIAQFVEQVLARKNLYCRIRRLHVDVFHVRCDRYGIRSRRKAGELETNRKSLSFSNMDQSEGRGSYENVILAR